MPVVTKDVFDEVLEKIIKPTIKGMANKGIIYKGVLYAGVMITKDGPKALEFNVRFGDPETQAVLPRLKSDIVQIMLATANEKLSRYKSLVWDNRACVCVVCASKGYPGSYEKGKVINGLDEVKKIDSAVVFHAGTQFKKPVTSAEGGSAYGS